VIKGRPIYLGKNKLSKKRESVGKLISLFRNFHRRMNYIGGIE